MRGTKERERYGTRAAAEREEEAVRALKQRVNGRIGHAPAAPAAAALLVFCGVSRLLGLRDSCPRRSLAARSYIVPALNLNKLLRSFVYCQLWRFVSSYLYKNGDTMLLLVD